MRDKLFECLDRQFQSDCDCRNTQRTPKMTYTNTQLKQALARMLPDKCYTNSHGLLYHRRDGEYQDQVRNTELLHLCWLVGKDVEAKRYSDYLMHAIQDEICTGAVEARYATANATWQQRVIALAKVKGVEIV